MIAIKSKTSRGRRLHLPLPLLALLSGLSLAACGAGGDDDATSGPAATDPGVEGKADDGDETDAGAGGAPAEAETGGTPAAPEAVARVLSRRDGSRPRGRIGRCQD